MDPDADLAFVASLMADRHRAQMLLTLLGGTPQSGSALAEAAGISRSLASAHLKKLVAGGLVRAQPSGRQQLYSIASEPVADALEILILLAPASAVRSLGDATRAKSLRWARMCYDHLAGAVGVSVTEALIGRGLLRERDGAYLMEPVGAAEFGDFGIEVGRLERRTRPLLRPCLDWSERRYHLAGSLGAALTSALAERRWITTREASRIVTVTEAGHAGLREWLGIDLAKLRVAA
jgi:DNA-binding transcriptional ArsR family regulator